MKIILALALSVVTIGSAVAAESMAVPRRPSHGISVARGQQVFVELCALCHGMKGKGDGPRSTYFPENQYIPDLTTPGFVEGRDAEILGNNSEGVHRMDEPFLIMPQFKYILAEDDIKSALAYVKTLPGKARK